LPKKRKKLKGLAKLLVEEYGVTEEEIDDIQYFEDNELEDVFNSDQRQYTKWISLDIAMAKKAIRRSGKRKIRYIS